MFFGATVFDFGLRRAGRDDFGGFVAQGLQGRFGGDIRFENRQGDFHAHIEDIGEIAVIHDGDPLEAVGDVFFDTG